MPDWPRKKPEGDRKGEKDFKRVSLVLHRLSAIDPRYRRQLAQSSRTKMKLGVQALTRTVLRLASGEDVSPEMRQLLAKALSSGLQLVPKRPKPGRTATLVWHRMVAGYIWNLIRRHYPGVPLKTIYADAGEKFGLSASQARQIWSTSQARQIWGKSKRRFKRK
jgi:hypothetical protein